MAFDVSKIRLEDFLTKSIDEIFTSLGEQGLDLGNKANKDSFLKELQNKLGKKQAKRQEQKQILRKFDGLVQHAKVERKKARNEASGRLFGGKKYRQLSKKEKKQVKSDATFKNRSTGKVKAARAEKEQLVSTAKQERKEAKQEVAQDKFGKKFGKLTKKQKKEVKQSEEFKQRDVGKVKEAKNLAKGVIGAAKTERKNLLNQISQRKFGKNFNELGPKRKGKVKNDNQFVNRADSARPGELKKEKGRVKGKVSQLTDVISRTRGEISAEQQRLANRSARDLLEDEINAFISGQRGLGQKFIDAAFQEGVRKIGDLEKQAQRQLGFNFAARGFGTGVRTSTRSADANKLNIAATETVSDLARDLEIKQAQSLIDARDFGIEAKSALTETEAKADAARKKFEADKLFFEQSLAQQQNVLSQNLNFNQTIADLENQYAESTPTAGFE